jgi:hypothetical protein
LKTNEVNLFVSSVLLVFLYHSPKFLDTPRDIILWDHRRKSDLSSTETSLRGAYLYYCSQERTRSYCR